MDEQIFATFLIQDKPVPLGVVEPLNFTDRHVNRPPKQHLPDIQHRTVATFVKIVLGVKAS